VQQPVAKEVREGGHAAAGGVAVAEDGARRQHLRGGTQLGAGGEVRHLVIAVEVVGVAVGEEGTQRQLLHGGQRPLHPQPLDRRERRHGQRSPGAGTAGPAGRGGGGGGLGGGGAAA